MTTESDHSEEAGGQRTVDWLASLTDEELAAHKRKLAEPVNEKTHPGTGYRSAAFASWRRGIHQQMADAESTERAVAALTTDED